MLAVVVALLAQVPAPATPAEAQVEKGRVLIRELYEEQALEVLRPLLDDTTLEPALRARALVYAGIAQMNLGQEPVAKQTFRRALEVDIGAVLPEWVSRRVRQTFDSQLKELMAERAVPVPSAVVVAPVVEPEKPKRPIWVAVTLGGAAAASAIVATISFTRWSDYRRRAEAEPVGLPAQQLDRQGGGWFIAGEVLTVAAVALAGAALAWWLWPSE